MSGHRHNPTASTQNQGNSLGDRSCVRQSRLYRVHESGNNIKSVLGTAHLCWDTTQKEGAYQGHDVYDHMRDDPLGVSRSHARAQQQTDQRRYGGESRDQGSGNFYSGYNNDAQSTDYRRNTDYSADVRNEGYRQSDYQNPRGNDGRRASLDRDPIAGGYGNDARDGYDGRNSRRSFHNDENRGRNQAPYADDRQQPTVYKEDRNYRSLREQLDQKASGYDRKSVADFNGGDQERSAIRTYRGGQQDKSTRPW